MTAADLARPEHWRSPRSTAALDEHRALGSRGDGAVALRHDRQGRGESPRAATAISEVRCWRATLMRGGRGRC
jgi:hypothetical protein